VPLSGPTRVLILVDQPLITRTITLTLDHGVCITRGAQSVSEATAVFHEWQPHLAIIDMDIGGTRLVNGMTRSDEGSQTRIPVLALTRRGDLQTKLAAFEQGVDDIMTVPSHPRSCSRGRWRLPDAPMEHPSASSPRSGSGSWRSTSCIARCGPGRPRST
jgi:CheY-like chemotaxis protein